MRVLIMTGHFGMGHIKCAETIKDRILNNKSDLNITDGEDVQVDVVDFIEYMYPTSSKLIYEGFNMLVSRCSNLYNRMNVIAGRHKVQVMKQYSRHRLHKLMCDYKPDLVIAVLPICGQYFSMYKKAYNDPTPLYVCITDITFHNEWMAEGTDKYFVGDLSTQNALISRGVDPAIIHITGIPVSTKFISDEQDTVRRSILVMGGGLGLVPGGYRTLEVLNNIENADVTLICGTNRKLYATASKEFANINVIGYTDNIPELMNKASVVITKPGGITTFEAIASGTPLYIINPNLEQEIGNARYIESNNIGRIIYDAEDFTEDDIRRFIEDDNLINTMKDNMSKLRESFENSNLLTFYLKSKEAA